MPEKRTTDIALPNPGPPDPTIPTRARRQADLELQRTSRAYESKPPADEKGLTLPRLARSAQTARRRVTGRS